MKKIIIYARVSTDKQSHESQLNEMKQYCERRSWENVHIITDTISGSKMSRDGLNELMTMTRSGKVDVVVCFSLDRLGRSLAHLVQILSEFATNKVAFICPKQGIDTSEQNPAASLQLNILCAVAQFEREIIKERVTAGIAAARLRGVTLGRPSKQDQRRPAIAQLLQKGLGLRAISRETGLPVASVYRIKRQMACAALIP